MTQTAPGEFVTEPVPREHTVGWFRVGLISAMVGFSLPTFVTGIEIARVTSSGVTITSILAGGAILTLVASLSGSIGARTRLSSYLLAQVAFGRRGAALVNIAFAVSLLGWFGVNIDLFSAAALRLLHDAFLIDVPSWIVEVGAGTVMTVTTIYGFRAINLLSMVLVPVMMVVTVLLINQSQGIGQAGAVLGAQDALSFGDAVSSVVGGVIIGAVIMPDITRFIREWRGAFFVAVMSYLLVGSIVMIAGGMAADAFDNDDLLDVMLIMGLGWGAFSIIIAGSWVLNSLNLYSTMLSVEATIPKIGNRLLVVLLGVLGTGAAFLNILDNFLDFLFYLAIAFVPVAGVIIVDYLFVGRAAYHQDFMKPRPALSPPALFAWLAGAMVALFGSESTYQFSGIAAVDAIVISATCHGLLCFIRKSLANRPGKSSTTERPQC